MVAEASAERASSWGAHRGGAVSLSARREAQLVARAQRGESAAVEELFASFWPMCHRAAWLITQDQAGAEDVA